MEFEAILFDCDGVLVDSETIYVSVEREHLARIGALNTSQIPQITGMLDAMAAGEETLQLPLNLRSGTVFLGPIPVFTLP